MAEKDIQRQRVQTLDNLINMDTPKPIEQFTKEQMMTFGKLLDGARKAASLKHWDRLYDKLWLFIWTRVLTAVNIAKWLTWLTNVIHSDPTNWSLSALRTINVQALYCYFHQYLYAPAGPIGMRAKCMALGDMLADTAQCFWYPLFDPIGQD